MEAYSGFAQVYDFLMKDVDYEEWVNYIEEIFHKEGLRPHTILELGCGTGNITNRLAKKRYDVIGVDISNEMLTFAKNKSYDLGVDVKYLNQDMRYLDFNKNVDCVLCLCDGFNYIIDENHLSSTFKKIHSLLKQGGVFIFDISSYYKLSEILGDNVYGENYEDVSYIWQNYFNDETNICELDLTIFTREDKLFKRHREYHYQRAYKAQEVFDILERAAFKNICGYKAFTFENFKYKDERICFVCRK